MADRDCRSILDVEYPARPARAPPERDPGSISAQTTRPRPSPANPYRDPNQPSLGAQPTEQALPATRNAATRSARSTRAGSSPTPDPALPARPCRRAGPGRPVAPLLRRFLFIVFVVVIDGLRQKADAYQLAGGPAANTEHITLRPADPLEVEQDLNWTAAATVGRRHPCRLLQPPQPARIRPHRCAASLSSSASRSSRSSSSAALSYDNNNDRPATIARNLEQAACNSAPANTAESRSKSRITRAKEARAWARSAQPQLPRHRLPPGGYDVPIRAEVSWAPDPLQELGLGQHPAGVGR